PLLGPHAGHLEEIGAIDVLSKALELGLVMTLATMLVRLQGFKPSFGAAARLATAFFLSVSVALVLAGVFTREEHEDFPVFSQPELPSPSGAPAQALPTRTELLPLLTRGGYGPGNTSLDVRYSPPLLFQVEKDEPPASSLERPTAIFFVFESDHEHEVGLPPRPPQLLLRVDGGVLIEPYEVIVLRGSAEGEHRTSRLSFPLPPGLDPATMDREEHTLTLVSPLGSVGDRMFSWQLPLELPGGAAAATVSASASPPDVAANLQVSGLTQRLTRTLEDVQYEGRKEIRIDATYATQEYFAAAFPADVADRYPSDQFTAFLLTERLHTAVLPGSPPDVVLSLDGQTYSPDMAEEVTTSPHHRVTLIRFPTEAPAGVRHRVMELLLPGDAVMTWHLPISYAGLEPSSGLGVSWVWLLAVMGGLVAAMWPCLFQLTVFFIPALGGLSMHEASGSVSLQRRAAVVKAALFFVLGFTVVYTAAGALIGFFAGRLGDLSGFYTWQRYLGIGGGVVIILLALRVATQARAPLVCKMPVLSRMGQSNRPANPLQMMVAGVAFATGCMTCFGAAIVVAMVVYVGLAGSAVIGAFTLFLFSMGMGIPLVIAATAMAKVLPVLSRFERAIRWIGLASSLVMVGFAVLLITGNYMVLTEWVYRMMPVASIR
ncbi:MAG: cytochrome c biogenesis protein CcdA, partial [Chloroflexi bacterium]|nr:cytochrome c biogenesis protein CcdA [Chloroflexota bacterium]